MASWLKLLRPTQWTKNLVVFAGIVFAASFRRSLEPDRDFGANTVGAMLGGLAENSSMLLGFQHLMLVAMVFYALSAVTGRSAPARSPS